jgi:3-hydroxyisobutyrate dehydrogenase-like beta-hydroxyacid dehydrogenase
MQDDRTSPLDSAGVYKIGASYPDQDRTTASLHEPPSGKIGFVGLGLMGTAMAANLAASGFPVTAYVRRPPQMNELRALGVAPTLNISDLLDCEIVINMLPDDNVVRDVFFGGEGVNGLADRLSKGTIHLSMSTISTAAAAEFARGHLDRGQGYVAAPVFGNPDAAKSRQLSIIIAGDEMYCARCLPLIESLGHPFLVGSDPQQANLIKLLGNMMTATSLEVLGEVTTVLRKSGQDPRQFVDIMITTMFGSRVHKIYGGRIVAGDYVPGLSMPLALKDVRLALAEAEKAGAPMPSVSVVRDRMITAIARGHAELDWTALGLVAAEEAGL